MNEKLKSIINWVLSVMLCSLGICLCTKASFGLSMISAPPYIVHVFLRNSLPWFSQGTAEYVWEAIILVFTCIAVHKVHAKYFLSLLTAVISGFVIDFWIWVFGGNGVYAAMPQRIIAFVLGSVIISIAIAFVFRTNLPPQVYELIVGEVADKYHFDKSKTKLIYDLIMLVVTLVLARVLNHSWDGVGAGTVIVAFVNAPMIKFFGNIIDKFEKNGDKNSDKA